MKGRVKVSINYEHVIVLPITCGVCNTTFAFQCIFGIKVRTLNIKFLSHSHQLRLHMMYSVFINVVLTPSHVGTKIALVLGNMTPKTYFLN
jgi:hypothetical protein